MDPLHDAHTPAHAAIARALSRHRGGPLIVGIAGAQGSGKSTLAARLAQTFGAGGLRVACLSIDDLYLPRADRLALAAAEHPLWITRGPPGTHDIALGHRLFDALAGTGPVRLPRFDKAVDDRLPDSAWPVVAAPVDLILFEGWLVGARPQDAVALAAPVNALERDEDADGRWRRRANQLLATLYQPLFARIAVQILLAAPAFSVVHRWRAEQEAALPHSAMDTAALTRFIAHYERLTRHILTEMPARADCLIRLDANRRVVEAVSLSCSTG
ncbi:kinase [Sphingomonas flavalba]|uniref:kinase n=1 Tax=Sphingomonas flavalba TaxID=2559804 RepID=UPI00109DEF82|nr:kinase [Sphingomonas flavalba]